MYFCRIAVLFYRELLSLTSCLISLKSLLTIIPLPRFVSSPGLMIQTLCSYLGIDKGCYSVMTSGGLGFSGCIVIKVFYECYVYGLFVIFS